VPADLFLIEKRHFGGAHQGWAMQADLARSSAGLSTKFPVPECKAVSAGT